ncbi:hypothetical protein T09_7771 [Trichinella sp. T9]|nr:hypothetical protein T09_7771 [Trichinella sp. T9]
MAQWKKYYHTSVASADTGLEYIRGPTAAFPVKTTSTVAVVNTRKLGRKKGLARRRRRVVVICNTKLIDRSSSVIMIMQAAAAVSQSVKRSRSDEQIVAGKQNQVIGVLIVVVIEKMKRTNSSSSSSNNNNNNKWLQSIPTFYMHTLRLGKSRAEEKGTIVGQSRPNTDGRASTELSTKELKNAPTFPPDTGYGHERSSFRKRGTFPQAIVDYITFQDNNTIQYNTI